MFTGTFFPPSYFAPTYWPGSGSGPPPTQVAEGFFEAFAAWFRRDPVCTAACPGGVVDAEAAPAQHVPYARLWDLENQEPDSPDDQSVEVALSAYGADDQAGGCGDKVARDAGVAVLNRLTDPEARGQWDFRHHGETWTEAGVLWIPPGKVSLAGKAAGGVRLWRYDLWFKFFLVRQD